ncbi:PREDICTED: C-type lectin domain family 4 member M-like [Branchiostoma belcheri]|uniref:C-type lectin domain family 4 member M-like n=1 Tax=Branchiostoma belcheri TaxID=7741 RepID=A0A6P5AM92_BRABE|nr:PREDICTED: C-type lectin domain family 4 member M-like [Branchiostoma belcheri]
MEENVSNEACRVFSSCNDLGDSSNDYEEACTVSPPKMPATKIGRASGLNPAPGTSDVSGEPGSFGSKSNDKRQAADPRPASAETAGYMKMSVRRIGKAPDPNPAPSMSGVSGEPGSSKPNDKRQAADPGPASAETAGYIPGVGMRSPAVTVSDLKLAFNKLDQKTTDDLKGLKLSVSKLDQKTADDLSGLKLALNNCKLDKKTTDDLSDLKLSVSKLYMKTAGVQANLSGWIHRQQELEDNMKNEQEKPEKERASIRLLETCPDGYQNYREVCYMAFHLPRSFSVSAETCRFVGGTLAMPRDAGINDLLTSLVDPASKYSYWFGLHRQEGKWEWIDGTALGTGYNRWAHGERKSCAWYRPTSKQWYTADCEQRGLFICQVLTSGLYHFTR